MLEEVGSLFKKNIYINNVILIIPCYNPLFNSSFHSLLRAQKSVIIHNFLTRIKNKFSYNMKQTDSKYFDLNRRYKKYKNRGHFCASYNEVTKSDRKTTSTKISYTYKNN